MLTACARGGVEAITARRVAREIGCSPMALYRHFESMEELVAAAWVEQHARLSARVWPPADQVVDPIEELTLVFRNVAAFAVEQPHLLRFILATPIRESTPNVVARVSGTFVGLRELVRRGVAEGCFRAGLDPVAEAAHLACLLIGVATLSISPRREIVAGGSPGALLDATVRRALADLLPVAAAVPLGEG